MLIRQLYGDHNQQLVLNARKRISYPWSLFFYSRNIPGHVLHSARNMTFAQAVVTIQMSIFLTIIRQFFNHCKNTSENLTKTNFNFAVKSLGFIHYMDL